MIEMGISGEVINECLNHTQPNRMIRVYVQDRREAAQAVAFDKLVRQLAELVSGQPQSNVIPLRTNYGTNPA